jgi:hypothetical protein
MKSGLRKILIGSAALLLLLALVTPGISASNTGSNTSSDTYDADSSSYVYVAPTTQPPAPAIDEMTKPEMESEQEVATEEPIQEQPETQPMPESESEEEIQPESESESEEILIDMLTKESTSEEPDSSYSFEKQRGKSNPQGNGYSGKKKIR